MILYNLGGENMMVFTGALYVMVHAIRDQTGNLLNFLSALLRNTFEKYEPYFVNIICFSSCVSSINRVLINLNCILQISFPFLSVYLQSTEFYETSQRVKRLEEKKGKPGFFSIIIIIIIIIIFIIKIVIIIIIIIATIAIIIIIICSKSGLAKQRERGYRRER